MVVSMWIACWIVQAGSISAWNTCSCAFVCVAFDFGCVVLIKAVLGGKEGEYSDGCAEYNTGSLCAECKDNSFPGSSGLCHECRALTYIATVFVALLAVLFLVGVYFVAAGAADMRSYTGMGASIAT